MMKRALAAGIALTFVGLPLAAGSPFPPGNYANRLTEGVLSNPAIAGVLIAARWRELEPAKGCYDWTKLDELLAAARAAGKAVVLNVMTAGVNVPLWVLDDPRIVTFSFTATNPHQPIYGQTFTVPVYWDEVYEGYRYSFIRALGRRYAAEPAVVGVMATFLGTVNNDWFIPKTGFDELLAKGYSTERMAAVGQESLDVWAEAFPYQALKLPLGLSIPADAPATSLAELTMAYGYERYPDRFYAQINALCTAVPRADDPEVREAPPGDRFYLLRLLAQHPGHIGFQLLCDATNHGERLDNRHLCPGHKLQCVLEHVLSVALSYAPHYIEYWHADAENPELIELLAWAEEALKAQREQR